MKRYTPAPYTCGAPIIEAEDGCFVGYEDVAPLEARIRELEKWPHDMAKVNGLGNEQTPEECGDFVVDLINRFMEIKAENAQLRKELDSKP